MNKFTEQEKELIFISLLTYAVATAEEYDNLKSQVEGRDSITMSEITNLDSLLEMTINAHRLVIKLEKTFRLKFIPDDMSTSIKSVERKMDKERELFDGFKREMMQAVMNSENN